MRVVSCIAYSMRDWLCLSRQPIECIRRQLLVRTSAAFAKSVECLNCSRLNSHSDVDICWHCCVCCVMLMYSCANRWYLLNSCTRHCIRCCGFFMIYRVVQKMAPFIVHLIISPNINRFSKKNCQNQKTICNKSITIDPTTPQVCHYTTL